MVFTKTFQYLRKCLPKGLYKGKKTSETPPALFEAISIGVARYIMDVKKIKIIDLNGFINSKELSLYLGSGSNSRKKMKSRIESVTSFLKGA